jgi:RNA polymerase sigma-70 factor (ECF subfamily)
MTVGELAELARRAQSGDEAARDDLLAELYCSVRKHIHLVLGSRVLVEDAVQETMIALYLGLPRFRGDASPRTWALTIATRVARKLRAWEARYDLDNDDMADTSVFDCGPAEAAELALLQRALAKLAPKKRDAFVLMAIFELSAEAAGRVLEVPANTAASQYRHARAELQARFKRMEAPTRLDVSRTPGAVES